MPMNIELIKTTIAGRHKLKMEQVGIKAFGCTLKTEGKARNFTATITSDRLDRDEEVLLPEGMDGSEFLAGAKTIFWNHDYNLPIGAARTLRKFDNRWESDAAIASNTQNMADFFPDYVWSLMEQAMIGGISVGFKSLESRNPTAKDLERYGPNLYRVISKWKLLEWSIAPLQSNIDGVVTAVQKGLITPDTARRVFPDLIIPAVSAVLVVPFPRAISIQDRIAIGAARARGKLYLS